MAAASDQMNQSLPEAGEEEEIILLTDVVEDPPTEVVLDLTPGEPGLDSLFLKESNSREAKSPPEAPAVPAGEELDDFLASLKDLPDDLGTPVIPSSSSSFAPEARACQAGFEELVHQELTSFLSGARFTEIVREVVQETVEKMSRELVPQIAAQVLEQKIAALLRRLAEEK